MSNKILVFLLPLLLSANLAQALTCKSGDSACATNSAAECEKLGYAKADVTGCSHYLYCPFDTAYKTCSSTSSVATADCTSGYAKSVDSCGSTGAKGWSLGNKDANGCGKCTAKECPKVDVYISNSSSGSSSIEIQSSTDSNVENCGSFGSKGYTITATGNYSGNSACYVCEPNSCPSGYTTNVASCGKYEGKGWALITSSTASGDAYCGKCTKKSCSSGASENATGILFNHLNGTDLTQSAYAIFTPNGEYTGNTRCGTFTLNTREICSEYIDDKRACGYGLDYDRSYDDIFDACQNGGDAESDCTSLNDCIRDVNNLWNRQYDVNYCFECGYSSDDGLACW